jgi:hypothetical protein
MQAGWFPVVHTKAIRTAGYSGLPNLEFNFEGGLKKIRETGSK